MKNFLHLCLVMATVSVGTLAASQSTKHSSTKTKHKVVQHKKHLSKKTVKNKRSVSSNKKKYAKKETQKVSASKKNIAAAAMTAVSVSDRNISEKKMHKDQEEKKNVVVTRGDIKVLEATENIRFLSQQIVKEYLLLFKVPRQDIVKEQLKGQLISLSNSLRVIAATTKDSDTKDILEFLAYSKDQIAQILTEKLNPEQAALMLDYSETLLEGADSIAQAHAYDFTKEEQMLMTTKQMEYLIERIMKYYMALHVGFNNPTNRDQMHEAIAKFSQNLQKIEAYPYPKKIAKIKNEVTEAWWTNGIFLGKSDTLFIPALMLLSTSNMEELITKIALYHTQNQ